MTYMDHTHTQPETVGEIPTPKYYLECDLACGIYTWWQYLIGRL